MSGKFSGPIGAALGVIGLTLGQLPASAQTNYLTDLGSNAPGLAINNSGQVVLQDFIYSGGTLTAFPANFTGTGINASGQVVGSVAGQNCPIVGLDSGQGCAIGVYANGVLTTYPIYTAGLGFMDPSIGNQGQGINASGQIVGDWIFTHGLGGAIVLTNGTFSQLRFPGTTCSNGGLATAAGVAYAINDAAQIAGFLPGGNMCQAEAFLYSQGLYHDIGAGEAFALNASGQVVGQLQFGNLNAAFLYSAGGTPTDLGTLPGDTSSAAYAIDAQGLLVGMSTFSPSTPPYTSVNRAFFYNGVMIDLNTFVLPTDPLQPYVTLTDARGINDAGVIVVNGVDSRTQVKHAYLLQAPLIKVAPGPLRFASQPIGTTSAPQTLTFTNPASTSIALGNASVSGGFSIQSNNCGSSLGPAATCTMSVVYAPTVAGNPNGALTLVAVGAPIAVPLTASSPLGASIKSSAATTIAGTPVTLTWSSSAGASCTATGGSSADTWTGSIATSGSKAITESAAGTYTYGISCTAGSQTQTAQSPVVVTWPIVTASISASPMTVGALQPTTLSWTSTNATSCVGHGGGGNDGWADNGRPTSGSVPVTEPNTPTAGASETLTFSITCTSSVSNLSATASVKVVQNGPSGSGGGGGALDWRAVVFLAIVVGFRRRAQDAPRPSH